MTENKTRIIAVELTETEEATNLVFNFTTPIKLNLTSSSSTDLKKFFVQLINELIDGDFSLEFESEDRDIYSNISRTYVDQLNIEIKSIANEVAELESN